MLIHLHTSFEEFDDVYLFTEAVEALNEVLLFFRSLEAAAEPLEEDKEIETNRVHQSLV